MYIPPDVAAPRPTAAAGNNIEHGLAKLEAILHDLPRPPGATDQQCLQIYTRRVFFAGAWLAHRIHLQAHAAGDLFLAKGLVRELAAELAAFEATLEGAEVAG